VGRPTLRDRASLWIPMLCATGFLSTPVDGAENEPPDLEEITVTGSRIVRDGITAPTPVTVVSAERLQNLGATNISSVLNTLPSFRATSNPDREHPAAGRGHQPRAGRRGPQSCLRRQYRKWLTSDCRW